MKTSDSTNSLTELNPSGIPEKSCFICLSDEHENGEPLVDSKLLRNCGCKFSVHPACWNEWMKGKSDYDCPICRKDSMLRIKIPPNPVMTTVFYEEPRPSCIERWKLSICIMSMGAFCFLISSIVLWG